MSDWKESAAKRRDDRNTKSPESNDKSAKPSKKKNTKKWCKGKEGTPHKPECRKYEDVKGVRKSSIFTGWRVLVCTTCGKELEEKETRLGR
jgi:hypothetical protein